MSKELLNKDDLKNLNYILDNKIKDSISYEDANIIIKKMLLDMEKNNNYNHYKIYGITNLEFLDNDIIKYMLQNKEIMDKNGVYVILNNSCTDQQKIDYIKIGDENKNYDFIIEKIKDIEFLKSIASSDRFDYLKGVIHNLNKTEKIVDLLIDNLLKLGDKDENYKYINLLRQLFENTNISYSNIEKVMNQNSINSYFATEAAKNENITNEMIEKIMNMSDENGTNVMFARTELINNPNVDEKYKIEIIENKDKYPYFNSNIDNAVKMYIDAINKTFNLDR